MIIRSNGLGSCGAGCGCDLCKRGLGDVTTQTCPPLCGEPTMVDKLWGALTTQLPIGGVGIPVWLLAAAAFLAAGSLLAGPSSGHRRYS